MNDRIAQIIVALGLKRIDFAKKIGISSPFVSELCSGAKKASDRTIADICREFNVSEDWLRTGEGEMFVQKSEEEELAAAVDRLFAGEAAEFKRRLVIALASLKDEHWILLEEKLKKIVGTNDAAPVFSPAPISSASDAESTQLNREADAFAAMAREQFISEKIQESQALSAKESGAG